MNGLTLSPVVVAKQNELKRLRKEFIDIHSEWSAMAFAEREDLNIRYLNLIGKYLYENFRLSVEVRALKMRVEEIQKYLNKGAKIDILEVERKINEALAEYYKLIEQQTRELNALKNTTSITDNEMTELKNLYRLLVKATHPDLNPNQSEKMKELFLLGTAAYNNFDLVKLREIVLRIDSLNNSLPVVEKTLDEQIDSLVSKIENIKERIAQLSVKFPFTFKEKLKDKAWVKEEQRKMDEEKRQLTECKEVLDKRIDYLLKR